MKTKASLLILLMTAIVSSCGNNKKEPAVLPISEAKTEPGDSTIYGLACDGCSDTVIVLLPNSGGDPVTYNILEATRKRRVFGRPQVGDWLGVILSKTDKHVADMVIDLEEVKGTWTYQVLPTWKERAGIDKRRQQQMANNLPDSIKETLMVPREYGFTLNRQRQASPVGFVNETSTMENESPVTYPPVKYYTEWKPYNGKLILIQGAIDLPGSEQKINSEATADTAEFVMMRKDSLVLRFNDGTVIGYHRKKDAYTANAAANQAAEKRKKEANERLK